MRYGMNPHQPASIVAGYGPRVINGEPSMINYLDALNAFELVREADEAAGAPAAASFKHVSPAGAALAGVVDATAARTWRVDQTSDGGLLSAYVRARDADPKSSFGDVVALSRPVDAATAAFLRTVICDGLITPGFEPGTAGILAAKRDGRFLILEADPGRTPLGRGRRPAGVGLENEEPAVALAGQERGRARLESRRDQPVADNRAQELGGGQVDRP
jgi:phosphoribosylaminoimidazolecarboxamide formyltransferase/IMP cyclohydrolase